MKLLIGFCLLIVAALALYYIYPERPLPTHCKIDRLVVYKSKHIMQAYCKQQLVKTYAIALGGNPVGPKEYEGDEKTPEGTYTINDRNPHSVCYKNLGISYPNAANIRRAQQLDKPPGGAIKIHGLSPKNAFLGKFHRYFNWTNGCIGVTNQEIDELYNAVAIGSPIVIKP